MHRVNLVIILALFCLSALAKDLAKTSTVAEWRQASPSEQLAVIQEIGRELGITLKADLRFTINCMRDLVNNEPSDSKWINESSIFDLVKTCKPKGHDDSYG